MTYNAHALVVGISQYQHVSSLPRVADAEDVASVLRDPASCGYEADHVMLLQDEEATRARILDELDRLGRCADAEATVLVYFSGHGGRLASGDSYLITVDTVKGPPAQLDATAITSRLFCDKLAAIAAGRVLVVLDCCHAADLAHAKDVEPAWTPGLAEDALDRLAAGRGRVVMAASRGDGSAYVMPGARHSLFTEHLIAGLRGAAGRDDGLVRVLDLYDHVQRNVVARNAAQRPTLKTELEDNFPVSLARRAMPGLDAPHPPPAFAYDVLVVHASDDRDRSWTMTTLVCLLEQRGLQVAVENRDAELGEARLLEIERLVTTSRFTIPVLTPRFSKGRFEELQTVMAQQLGVEEGRSRLIPVVREPCEARLGVRMLVHLDMTRDEEFVPGVDRLVRAVRKRAAVSETTS